MSTMLVEVEQDQVYLIFRCDFIVDNDAACRNFALEAVGHGVGDGERK